jgi:hypothetical protein
MRRVILTGLLFATAAAACALAGSEPSKNNPILAAKDETPSRAEDVPPGVSDALGRAPDANGIVHNDAIITGLDGQSKIRISYEETDGINVAEGDMILPVHLDSATSLGRYWPNGTIPYVIDTSLPSNDRVTQAIAHWMAKTIIKFVPRTTEVDYVQFRAAGGCSSSIGQQGGIQYVNLDTGESPSSVMSIGIDRSGSQEKVVWFYKRGYATVGSLTATERFTSHFRYLMPPGKAMASMLDVAIASNGHVFAFFDDGTVSEGNYEDLSFYSLPKPYAVAAGKTASDVLSVAIDKDDKAHAFYKDGTFSVGTTEDLAASAEPAPFTLAAGKTPADLARVEFSGTDGFVAFYNEMTTPDAGAPYVGKLPHSSGTPEALAATSATLVNTAYSGHCSAGAAIHEIGHAVGLFHEQTRFDRDSYIKINWENITPANRFNFEKHSKVVGTDTGPYDFGSIMHYGGTAFSIDGVKKTMEALDGHDITEQRDGLSAGDLVGVEAMYGKRASQ